MRSLLTLLLMAMACHAAEPRDTVVVDPETEQLLRGTLSFLARNQGFNGSWAHAPTANGEPVAMTGYALMAFLSTGNLPEEGEYARNVAAAVQYLVGDIGPEGLFHDANAGRYMYNHGMATTALAEVYGQTHSPLLRQRLEQLVGVIVNAQAPAGGWRYAPQPRDADISVTVLQVAALRAAKNAGLAVPQAAIDRAIAFVQGCYSEREHGFAYMPGGGAGFARTAAGLYSLQVCGKYDDARAQPASAYLFDHDKPDQEWWPYGCYYAAPAQYMIGGDTWKRWYAEMKARLLPQVIHEGDMAYWDQKTARNLGAVYETAVFTTVLALPYHYLPLYQR